MNAPEPLDIEVPAETTAERLLRLLALRGVEVLFANWGTDLTPLIDGLAQLADEPSFGLRVVQVPHGNTAVAMAHGHFLLSKRPQAVTVHVNVGTANTGLGLINARRARIPMLAMAGRTPWHEEGMAGLRASLVKWGQDAVDRMAGVPELTGWDHELMGPCALEALVDRALAIAASEPAGPVYLTLPREPLLQLAPAGRMSTVPRQTPSRATRPDDATLETARRWIRRARQPLVITSDLGRYPGGPEALVSFATAAGAGVVEHGKRTFLNFPTEHPHHLGFDPTPLLDGVDLILAVECPVPWLPGRAKLAQPPPVISIAVDPLFADLPFRSFPSDLSLAGDPAATLRALADGLERGGGREELSRMHDRIFREGRERARGEGKGPHITRAYLAHAIGEALDEDVILFNESDLDPLMVPRRKPDTWFERSMASGLGWSLGAALGAKLAAPDRTIVVTVGDGTYLLNAPLSAHCVAVAEQLPVLTIVLNDRGSSAIECGACGGQPEVQGQRADRSALTDFVHGLDYERVIEACGGIGMRVERPTDLPAMLCEALALVRDGKRHVLMNVICERGA